MLWVVPTVSSLLEYSKGVLFGLKPNNYQDQQVPVSQGSRKAKLFISSL